MSKYEPLSGFLKASGQETVELSFAEIEKLIGAPLPASARKHRAWWSNNPNNSVVTKAWLDAGYRTRDVDIAEEHLTFARTGAKKKLTWDDIYGCMKGTLTVAPGYDVTQPADPDWAKVYDDPDWGKEFGNG